jgi:hypothetical protein
MNGTLSRFVESAGALVALWLFTVVYIQLLKIPATAVFGGPGGMKEFAPGISYLLIVPGIPLIASIVTVFLLFRWMYARTDSRTNSLPDDLV